MAPNVKRPTDPYDPAWTSYRAQNPGLRLSLSAADVADPAPNSDPDPTPDPAPTPAAPDMSFIPDAFKAEDGTFKVEDFRASYDDLASFKAQSDEAKAALPEAPEGYAWALPEDYAFAEGFDPAHHQIPVVDENGAPVMGEDGLPKTRDMEAADMINAKDPDLPLLQAAMHKNGASPELMGEIATILANRELRGLMKAGETAAAEKKALGPDGQSRIDTVKRSLAARLPGAQASAVLDGVTSADGLRGLEALIKNSTVNPAPAPGGVDLDSMTSKELIALGMKQQMSAK